jgi:hypothetical protein
VDQNGLAFEKQDGSPVSLVVLYKSSSKTDIVGETIIDQNSFASLRTLLVSLTSLNIKPDYIIFKDNGDFEVYTETSGKYIFGASDDLKIDVDNLKLLLDSVEFKNQTATSSKKIDYIDLRFGKKVYFKLL